jgi:hypothetical protein
MAPVGTGGEIGKVTAGRDVSLSASNDANANELWTIAKGSADVSPDATDDTTSAAGALVITFIDNRADARLVDVEVDAGGDGAGGCIPDDETNVAIGNAGQDDSYDAAVALSFVWSSATALRGGSGRGGWRAVDRRGGGVNAVTFGDAQRGERRRRCQDRDGLRGDDRGTSTSMRRSPPAACRSQPTRREHGDQRHGERRRRRAKGRRRRGRSAERPDRTDRQATTSDGAVRRRRGRRFTCLVGRDAYVTNDDVTVDKLATSTPAPPTTRASTPTPARSSTTAALPRR